jgi:hypothetical protein
LVLSGELDPVSRTDAGELVSALRERYALPDHIQLTTVPELAEPPGLQPAPQLPAAKTVDEAITQWFLHHLTTH